jgi:hypothetical protein
MTSSDNNPKQLKISQNHSQVTKAAKPTEKTAKIDIFRKKIQNRLETVIIFQFLAQSLFRLFSF